MRIAVDAMGGDNAPGAVISGSITAARDLGVEIILVGPRLQVEEELARHAGAPDFVVVDAPEVIEMHEPPAMALRRKKRASIVVAVDLLRDRRVDAVMTAGHTGAAMGAALLGLGRIKGVDRPALAVVLPTKTDQPAILLDVGANVDCKPHHLLQFALMGSVYASRVLRVASPRVGVLSNGVEEGKGSELVVAATGLLRQSTLNFVGNVEARDVFNGVADVIVCDGFVGNVTLKFGQGLSLAIRDIVKAELRGWRGRLLMLYAAPLAGKIRRLYRRIDYRETGGAPLLGIDGVVVVAHGSSNARAIRNAIRIAAETASEGFVDELRTRIPQLGVGAQADASPVSPKEISL